MKLSKLLRKAAELIATNNEMAGSLEGNGWKTSKLEVCCCLAIDSAAFADPPAEQIKEETLDFFKDYFKPVDLDHLYWWVSPSRSDRDQEARRLALLFAAEIAGSEGR